MGYTLHRTLNMTVTIKSAFVYYLLLYLLTVLKEDPKQFNVSPMNLEKTNYLVNRCSLTGFESSIVLGKQNN